jgi:hypothetical protein
VHRGAVVDTVLFWRSFRRKILQCDILRKNSWTSIGEMIEIGDTESDDPGVCPDRSLSKIHPAIVPRIISHARARV